jgi:hypothetical protein
MTSRRVCVYIAPCRAGAPRPPDGCAGNKTHLSPLCKLKVIILPRQARDRHRENTKRAFCFSRSRSPTSPIASLRWRSRALSALKRPAQALLTLCHRRGRRQRKLSPQQQRKTWRPLARTRRLSSSRLWPTQRCEKKRNSTTNQINSTQAKSNQINVGIAFVSVTQHRTVVSEWCGRWTHPHTAPAGAPSPPEIYLLAIDLRLTF